MYIGCFITTYFHGTSQFNTIGMVTLGFIEAFTSYITYTCTCSYGVIEETQLMALNNSSGNCNNIIVFQSILCKLRYPVF